jgi:hypothetical protein
MKDTVMDVVKTVANNVFSFGGFLFVAGLAFIYILIISMSADTAQNAACLKAGMVKVLTDGGNFCVAPTHLVELK